MPASQQPQSHIDGRTGQWLHSAWQRHTAWCFLGLMLNMSSKKDMEAGLISDKRTVTDLLRDKIVLLFMDQALHMCLWARTHIAAESSGVWRILLSRDMTCRSYVHSRNFSAGPYVCMQVQFFWYPRRAMFRKISLACIPRRLYLPW